LCPRFTKFIVQDLFPLSFVGDSAVCNIFLVSLDWISLPVNPQEGLGLGLVLHPAAPSSVGRQAVFCHFTGKSEATLFKVPGFSSPGLLQMKKINSLSLN